MSVRFSETEKERLANKALHEKRSLLVEAYTQRDTPEFPGWTFLIKEVKEEYGICPFLNLSDPDTLENRKSWLQTRSDSSEVYSRAVERFNSPNGLLALQEEIKVLRATIVDYVQCPDLVEEINVLKGTSSRTKKTKLQWDEIRIKLNDLFITTGIAFELYLKHVHGISIPFVNRPGKADPTFSVNVVRLESLLEKLNFESSLVKLRKQDAEKDLADLIDRHFQIEQVGKYFKRWGLLTVVQQEERLASFCEFLARNSEMMPHFAKEIVSFVKASTLTKKIRASDIKWVLKSGVIDEIMGLSIVQGEIVLSGRTIAPKTKKVSKRKPSDLQEKDYKRLNRLLLFELMQTSTPQKVKVIKTVSDNFHPRLADMGSVYTYLSVNYERFTQAILNCPVS